MTELDALKPIKRAIDAAFAWYESDDCYADWQQGSLLRSALDDCKFAVAAAIARLERDHA